MRWKKKITQRKINNNGIRQVKNKMPRGCKYSKYMYIYTNITKRNRREERKKETAIARWEIAHNYYTYTMLMYNTNLIQFYYFISFHFSSYTQIIYIYLLFIWFIDVNWCNSPYTALVSIQTNQPNIYFVFFFFFFVDIYIIPKGKDVENAGIYFISHTRMRNALYTTYTHVNVCIKHIRICMCINEFW